MTRSRRLRVLAVGPAPSGPHSRGGMATVMSQMLTIDDPRIDFVVVPTYNDTSPVSRWLMGVRGMLRAALLVLAGRVDIVHVHLSHGGSVLRKAFPLVAGRLRGVPTVVHAHSYNFSVWFEALPRPLAAVVRWVLKADLWLTLGNDLASEYRSTLDLSSNSVRVLHNPAPAPTSARLGGPRAHGPLFAVALGRLGERKGTFDIIAALSPISDEVGDRLTVVLAGDDQVEQTRSAAAPLGAMVQVRDWVNPDQRAALLEAGDIFLLPSYDEGLPMALLEAMAAGLAPITTPVGAIGDIIDHGRNGVLVAPGDVPSLAAAIRRMVEDDEFRMRVAVSARHTAEAMSVANWHAALIEAWLELTARE